MCQSYSQGIVYCYSGLHILRESSSLFAQIYQHGPPIQKVSPCPGSASHTRYQSALQHNVTTVHSNPIYIAVAAARASDHLLLMVRRLHSLLSDDLQIIVLSLWLDVPSLTTLDVAVSSRRLRPSWLTVLRCLRSDAIDNWGHSMSSLIWLSKRGIRASQVRMEIDNLLVRGCDILLVDTSDIVHLCLKGCDNITDQCIADVVYRCLKLRSIDITHCGKVADAGVPNAMTPASVTLLQP